MLSITLFGQEYGSNLGVVPSNVCRFPPGFQRVVCIFMAINATV